jgi:bifunctional non-homologous end joining protein LigD
VSPPRFIQPCSPTTASKPPTGERWTHEVKWDGFRFQIAKVGKEIRLFSRNGVDWTERMPNARSMKPGCPSTPSICCR